MNDEDSPMPRRVLGVLLLAWLCGASSDLDAVMGLLAMRQHLVPQRLAVDLQPLAAHLSRLALERQVVVVLVVGHLDGDVV